MDIFNLKKQKKYRRMVDYIWSKRPAAMRADLVRDLQLSRATVIGAVEQMVRAGVLSESDCPNGRKGRQPKALAISGGQCFAVGIAVRSDKADIALVDAGLRVLAVDAITGLARAGKKQLPQLLHAVKTALRRHKLDLNRLVGVGVTLPGMIDHRTGIVRKSSAFVDAAAAAPIIPFWEKALGKPCRLMEHSAALAFNEHARGTAVGMSDFLYLDGMGLGMFLDGRIYMGHQSYGGEIGFMKISDAQKVGGDGRAGTYNQVTPFRQLGLRLEQAMAQGSKTLAADLVKAGGKISHQLVIDAALQGDALCREMIEEGFRCMAEMAVNLNYLFNPEAILLWPWTAKCPEISLDIVRRRLEVCRLVNPDMQVKVLPARFGGESLAHGIAMLPLNDFFK